jgi:hypothetical protein
VTENSGKPLDPMPALINVLRHLEEQRHEDQMAALDKLAANPPTPPGGNE